MAVQRLICICILHSIYLPFIVERQRRHQFGTTASVLIYQDEMATNCLKMAIFDHLKNERTAE